MAATIVGGAVLQWPIGRLSDRGDRRTVMAVLGVAAAALAGTLALVGDVQGADGSQWRLYALFFVFGGLRSEEHTSELQSLMRISYAVFCLKKKKKKTSKLIHNDD